MARIESFGRIDVKINNYCQCLFMKAKLVLDITCDKNYFSTIFQLANNVSYDQVTCLMLEKCVNTAKSYEQLNEILNKVLVKQNLDWLRALVKKVYNKRYKGQSSVYFGRVFSLLIVKNISKNFGSFQALDKVSFEMNKGDIVGLLGKNGAGKTTLMRILTSFITASSGTVTIDGDDIKMNSLMIRQKIGYLPEKPPLYGDMTVQYYLKFAAEIKGVPKNKRLSQIAKVLEECDLDQVKQKTIATLSKGYKQRVGIAQAIIHEPKLLILDEPTSGLDPMQIQQVLALIKNQRYQRTVLLSTHTLTEIEKVAQRVLLIKSGRIVLDDPLDKLLRGTNVNQSQPLTLEQVFINYHQPQTSANKVLQAADE